MTSPAAFNKESAEAGKAAKKGGKAGYDASTSEKDARKRGEEIKTTVNRTKKSKGSTMSRNSAAGLDSLVSSGASYNFSNWE